MKGKYQKYIMVFLMIFLILILITQLISFVKYKSYLDKVNIITKNNSESNQIEDWMSPYLLTNHLNFSKEELHLVFNGSISKKESRYSIKKLCKKKKVSCDDIINNLNILREEK